KVKAERFIGGEYLDEYVASLKDSFQDKDLLFIEALASSLQNLREDLFSKKISAGNYHNFRQLFLSILPAALAEVRALREVRGDVSEQFEAALREFEDVSDAIASKIPEVQLLREPTASNGSVGARCEDMLTGK